MGTAPPTSARFRKGGAGAFAHPTGATGGAVERTNYEYAYEYEYEYDYDYDNDNEAGGIAAPEPHPPPVPRSCATIASMASVSNSDLVT